MGSSSGRDGYENGGNAAGGKHHLLSILCATDHLIFEKKYENGEPKMKNQILKMIQDELMLDHYYDQEKLTVIVKIDGKTLENPVLKDW